mgnify:CR=1 FL=1
MAEDFRIKVQADLDTAQAEQKLNALTKTPRKVMLDVEVKSKDPAKQITDSINKAMKSTKIDTSSMAQSIADSFNISDKSVISKLKSQMNRMVDEIGRSFDGEKFNFSNTAFFNQLEGMDAIIQKNAKVLKQSSGIYDDFYNSYKNTMLYISDQRKTDLGVDNYKALLKQFPGKITNDITKGVDINSIWSEITSQYQHIFSDAGNLAQQFNFDNAGDQVRAFLQVLQEARADMTSLVSAENMTPEQLLGISESAIKSASDAARKLVDTFQNNFNSSLDESKQKFNLDVDIDTEKIASDIRSALQSATNSLEDALDIKLKFNDEEISNNIRNAIKQVANGDEPVQVDIHVNKESLQADLNAALTDIDLPINFKIDPAEIEADIRAAVNNITDIELDLRVNATDIRQDIDNAVDNTVTVPTVDTSGLTNMSNCLNGLSNTGRQTQSVFQSLGGTFREAFSAYSMANLMQDALYKIADAGREAVSIVKDFDDVETDLAMATGESRSYVKNLVKDYNDMGQELGAVTLDVAKSADTWIRTGRSLSETNSLIKDSMVLSKDAQMSSDDASKVLISTLNGFQLAADQASHINDVLTSIDLKSASDAGTIGTGLSKVASMANDVGMSMEKTAGIIATVIDTSPQMSGEEAGNSVKGILSRLNNIKAGKFIDSESGEALNDTEKVLTKVGISMRDVNGQIMESESILDSVAEKWNTFDGNTKKAVATAMAGAHRINTLYAMMDNWDKVQSLTNTALTSDGTAEQKFNDNYLTSLEAKTNSLKSSLESLATATIPTDLYSGFLDGAKAVTDFTTQTDLLKNSLIGLGTAGGMFAFQQITSWIGGAIQEFANLNEALNLVKASSTITGSQFDSLMVLTSGLTKSQMNLVLSSTALSDAQRVQLLMNTGLSQAQAEAAVSAMGLATANGTAAGATVTLSGALSGLWSTLMANPFILVAAGVTATLTAFSAYKKSVQEAVDSAKDAGQAWQESSEGMQSQIDKITELRATLADSNTTEEEAYNAKKELFDIQEQLNSQYGSAVAGIDLMNGSLQDQIDLLNQASEAEANKFLNENRAGINEAKKKMTASVGNGINGSAYLGQIMQFGDADESIQEILKKYADKGISTMQNESDGTISIYFTGDATQAESVLNDFMTEVRAVGDEFGDSFSVDSVLENTGSVLKDAEDRISEYGDLYNQARQAELLTQKQEYKVDDHKAQTAAKWLKDYTDAINAYNDALVGGDSSQIEESANNFEAVDRAVNALLDQTSMSEWSDQFTDARSKLNDAGIAYQDFYAKVSGKDLSDKGINSFVEDLKDLNLSDVDFKYALETDGVQEGEEAIQGLTSASEKAGVPVDTLIGLLTDLGVISSGTAEAVDEIATATDDASSGLEGFLATQDNINAAIASSMSATGLSAEQITNVANAYSELEGYNPAELFEVTANGVHLNTNALRELQAQQTATAKSQFASEIEKQNQLLDEQQQKISDLLASGASQEDILGAQADASGIQSQIDSLIQLQAQLDGATSAYQRWLDAQSNGEEGDMYDSFQTAIKRGDELLSQGLVGTNEFRAIADLFSSEDLSTAPVEQLVEAYNNASPIIKSFFTEGAEGANNFIDKMIQMGYATENTETGLIDFSNVDTKQIADDLGVDVEAVEAIFKKLGDYGFDIKVSANIDDVATEVTAAKQRLDEINGYNATAEVKIDATGDEQIQHAAELIASLPEEKQVEIGVEEVGNVDSIVQQLVNQPDSINIETTETKTVNEQLGETVETVPDAEGTANFTLGNSPMTVPSASGVANFTLGNYPTSIPSVTQNVIVHRNVVTGATEATGTMLSPAHADGNVALKHDEMALSNEQGQESIVRDGKWQLLPPGAHIEHFRKNDIIFNAQQTKQLMQNGKISGYGKTIGGAYANGTYNGMPAHANVYASGKRPGSYGSGSSSSTGSSNNSGSSNSSGNNSKKKKSSSKSGADKVSKAIEKISKWVSRHFDWIEVKIDHLQKKADSYYTKAQNAIDQGLNRPNNYKKAESNIKNSIATNERLITANQQGSARYQKEANAVKKKYDSKLSKKNKATFDKAVKTLNDGGKIDISVYNADVKTALEDYQKWYDKVLETKYAVDDLNSTLIEQKQALFNLPIDQATAKVNKLEVALSKLQLRFAKKSVGKNTSIKTQNDELDDELKNQKSQLNAQKNALDKAKANLTSAKKDQKSNQKSIIKNRQSLVVDQMSKKVADVKVRSSSSDLLKDSKISKTLTKKQKADLKNGKSISLSKSQKRKLSKSQQSKISDYNKDVKSSSKIASKISTDKKNISSAKKSADSKNQTFQLAQDAYDTQLKTTNEAEKDYLEQIVANEKQKFDNVVSYFEKRTDLIEKQNSRKTAMGAYESAKDYKTLISQTTQEITEMNKQLNSSVKKGKIQVGSDEWYEMKSQIVETETELANLNETARKIRLQEMFERAAESVQKFIDKLQTVNSLITDDMKFDKDGKLTQNGALSMMLDSKSLDESKENLKTYTKERERILTTEWESKGYTGDYVRGVDSELDGLLDDVDNNIKSEVGNIQNYMQSLLNTVISANEKERDAILEVVDAHKEALSKKKDYYDYDKKMKNQNKTISELERQAAGLRGSTDKADKAQLQKIEAQLKDAKDERDDMVKDHLYEMQTDALDQISDDINKYYKEMIDALKNSPTEAANAITKFMSDNDITGAKLAEQISSVLKQYIDPNNKDSKGTEEEIKNSGLTGTLPSQLPENSKTLTDAFKDLVSKINTNGYGTAATTKQINDAQAAYNKLSSTEKSYVSADYEKFTDAKTANQQELDRAAKVAADKKKQQEDEAAKLKAFKNAVKSLGSDYWTVAMTDRIKAAETAYKKLTDAQKKTVKSQYNTLVATKKKNSNQGNGKIDVGDRVRSMQPDGVYKYSNQPLSKNKKLGTLKRNAPYFVGEYKKNDVFPVHLYSDKERKKSVGWVNAMNLMGYASGTPSVKGDQLAWVNENWNKNGGEIIYRKSDGAMLMPLKNGDTVFSADKVQALYKMLETNPLPMNMGNVFTPRDLTTQVQTVNNTPVNYNDSHNIIVQGDLTRDTLPNLQEILKKSSEYTQNEIRKDLVKAGRKKTFH